MPELLPANFNQSVCLIHPPCLAPSSSLSSAPSLLPLFLLSDPSIHPADAQTCVHPLLQGFSNNWLRVVPRTRFGAFARGAKVVLYTKKSGAHLRIIDGGSGYLCEMEPVAHFGLGESGLRGRGV